MDSILTSIKKLLGIAEEYKHFDADLIMHINAVFAVLHQLGVGPEEGFIITGELETWDEFIPEGQHLEAVKPYVYLKVKSMFDPPMGSAVAESMNRIISEFEWRIHVQAEVNAAQSDGEEELQNGY